MHLRNYNAKYSILLHFTTVNNPFVYSWIQIWIFHNSKRLQNPDRGRTVMKPRLKRWRRLSWEFWWLLLVVLVFFVFFILQTEPSLRVSKSGNISPREVIRSQQCSMNMGFPDPASTRYSGRKSHSTLCTARSTLHNAKLHLSVARRFHNAVFLALC